MKTTKYLSLAALALMGTLASCQSDDEAAVSFARPANAVGINVTVGAMQTTRSNPASADPDEAHLFNQDDQVCVSTDGQDPIIFQCQDADQQTWAEVEAGKFLLWKQSEMTFKAFYPATEGTSMTTFTLPTDQSTAGKIALADYMTRQQTCNNESSTDINLTLERKTARVIVRIAGFTDQYDNDEKTVSNVRINSQYSAIADGNGTGDITEVTPYMQGNGGQGTTFTALVVPTNADEHATFITLTDGLNNTLTVKGIPELEAGYSYTYDLTVGKNTIQVQSVTVTDWTNGTTLAGGQAQETPSVPEGAINGKFSVSATKRVYFSKGNLRYASGAWSFFDNQYDYYTSYSAAGRDKFGWSTSATIYGMNTSTKNSTYSGDFVDWGATMGTGWFTLSSAEWTYLFNTRTVNGGTGSGKSYTLGQSVNGKLGVVIYPDNYTGEVYSGSDWATFESAGCVFLPAAGYRDGSSVSEAGTLGSYWSATPNGTDDAFSVLFYSDDLDPAYDDHRDSGCRVRLVRQVEQGGAAAEGHALSASAVGEIVGTDGKAYAVADKDNLPSGVNAAGMVAYKNGSNGLVIALADEASTMNWSTANGETGAAAHTPTVTGQTWKLPSKDEWNQMFGANGGNNGLNTALATAGGDSSKLKEDPYYWSSSEDAGGFACFDVGAARWRRANNGLDYRVRACLAF